MHRKTKSAEETQGDLRRLFRPRSDRRGGVSNRQTPPELETLLTHTKQMTEVISNRQ
jgi:hypothetical protein